MPLTGLEQVLDVIEIQLSLQYRSWQFEIAMVYATVKSAEWMFQKESEVLILFFYNIIIQRVWKFDILQNKCILGGCSVGTTMIWKSTKRKNQETTFELFRECIFGKYLFYICRRNFLSTLKVKSWCKVVEDSPLNVKDEAASSSECVLSFPIYIDRGKQKIKDIVVIKWRIVKQLKIANVWMDKALY